MLQFKNTIRIFQKNCQTWKITSFKWRPLFWMHSFSLWEKLVITCSHIWWGMALISLSIAFCNWGISRGLLTYTFLLRYPPKKETARWQVRRAGGHGTSPLWEMSFPGNNLRNHHSFPGSVGSCPILLGPNSELIKSTSVLFGYKEISDHNNNRRNALSLNCHSLKKKKCVPINPNLATTAQTVTLSQCSGCSCTCRGLIIDQ